MATPVFVAVDTPDLEAATSMVGSLQMPGLGVKLGLEFFCAHGAAGVRSVVEAAGSAPLFLDLKFHDIPNTVAGAVRATVGLGAALLNVHAGGGPEMMRAAAAAAAEEAERLGVPRPAMLAVTVLTSLDDADLVAVGQAPPVREQVVRLAKLAKECACRLPRPLPSRPRRPACRRRPPTADRTPPRPPLPQMRHGWRRLLRRGDQRHPGGERPAPPRLTPPPPGPASPHPSAPGPVSPAKRPSRVCSHPLAPPARAHATSARVGVRAHLSARRARHPAGGRRSRRPKARPCTRRGVGPPSTRPRRAAPASRRRVMTPAQAMAAGATSLVVGRPITRADEPRVAAEAVVAEARGAAPPA